MPSSCGEMPVFAYLVRVDIAVLGCPQVLVASLQELARQLKKNGFSALNVSVV